VQHRSPFNEATCACKIVGNGKKSWRQLCCTKGMPPGDDDDDGGGGGWWMMDDDDDDEKIFIELS